MSKPIEIGDAHPISEIGLSSIKDGGAQMRVAMSPDIINEYAEAMLGGAVFPPIVLFFDGTDYWPGDGYHRIEAKRKLGGDGILSEIRKGSARDAILCAVGANAFHGLRRTQADRRRAIKTLLTDPEWAGWSDRKIGEIANVDHKTVGKIRRELSGEIPHGKPMGGEVQKPASMKHGSGSLVQELVRALSDDDLIAECRRRGLMESGDGL